MSTPMSSFGTSGAAASGQTSGDQTGSDTTGGEESAELQYRLVSIKAVSAPAGCTGRDWFVYRISQGKNSITGYRQGTRDTIDAQVDTIVSALNQRRRWPKNKAESTAQRRAQAAKGRAAAAAARLRAAER